MPILISCPGCKAKLRIRDEYAGKAMKCPRCSADLEIPAGDEEPVVATLAEENTSPQHQEAVTDQAPPRRPGSAKAKQMACPKCGKTIASTARRCRFCQADLGDAGDEEGEDRYLPCPRCGEPDPVKVDWTWWGSYFGPKLCSQVRCPECDHSYNGLTGGSNLLAKIVFVTVPLLLIAGILVALYFVLKAKNAI
jgi:hypothetical protein